MSKVMVTARIENLNDLFSAVDGLLSPEDVRSAVVDALVDTEATMLSLPKRLIASLGLVPVDTRQARTSAGIQTLQLFGFVRLTIQDREGNCDVVEVSDEHPV